MIDWQMIKARGRISPWRRAYIGGTFDCLHRGHLALFASAKRITSELIVSVNSDEFATRYKRRPLMPLADRMAVLAQCKLVDRVVLNTGDEDSKPAMLKAEVDCLIHGSDWVGESLLHQMQLTPEWLQEKGIDLVILPYTEWTSTTQLLEAYESRKK